MTSKEKSALQKEIVDTLDANPHGRLILAPRCGKTKIGIDVIKKNKPSSILWVTPSAELAEKDIPAEFVTWKAKRYVSKLTTSTWMSLHKLTGHYGMIILDEEQFLTENNSVNLINGTLTCDSLITMTGTASKHDTKKDLYNQLNLKVLYKISINEAVDIKLLSNYKMKILECSMSTDKVIEAGTKDKKWMTNEIAQYDYLDRTAKQAIYQNRADVGFRIMNRMRFVKNSPTKLKVAQWLFENLQGRVMMFCSTIAQAETVSPNTYHSKTDNTHLAKFKSGELDKITLVNAGGTGHTYKAVDHLVVVQSDSDKNGLTSQKICRTLLDQKDYEATVWMVSLIGTQDESWIKSTLTNFDHTKFEYLRFKNLLNTGL